MSTHMSGELHGGMHPKMECMLYMRILAGLHSCTYLKYIKSSFLYLGANQVVLHLTVLGCMRILIKVFMLL